MKIKYETSTETDYEERQILIEEQIQRLVLLKLLLKFKTMICKLDYKHLTHIVLLFGLSLGNNIAVYLTFVISDRQLLNINNVEVTTISYRWALVNSGH